jgi:hypothetical protein
MAIWYILWSFGKFYGHLVYFMIIWYILWPFGIFYPRFVILNQENSGSGSDGGDIKWFIKELLRHGNLVVNTEISILPIFVAFDFCPSRLRRMRL